MAAILRNLNWVTHPLAILVAQNVIVSLAAGFTAPHSPQRWLAFVFLVGCTWIGILRYSQHIRSTSYPGTILLGAIAGPVPLFFDRLMLRGWRYESRQTIFALPSEDKRSDDTQDPAGSDSRTSEDTFGSRYAFGQEVTGTIRGLGTPFEIKNIPPFSMSNPQYVPSPKAFVARKLFIMIVCYYLHEYVLVELQFSLNHDFLHPSHVPFFSRLSRTLLDDVCTRLLVCVITWLKNYCVLQLIFNIPSVISVCLNPSSVHEWRPFLGSVTDCYTIRGFWG